MPSYSWRRLGGLILKTYTVESSNIKSVGYDIFKQEMTIAFHGGNKYLYKDINQTTVCQLLFAHSIGKYFHKIIKPCNSTKL